MHIHQQAHQESDADADLARLMNAPEDQRQGQEVRHADQATPRQQVEQESADQGQGDKYWTDWQQDVMRIIQMHSPLSISWLRAWQPASAPAVVRPPSWPRERLQRLQMEQAQACVPPRLRWFWPPCRRLACRQRRVRPSQRQAAPPLPYCPAASASNRPEVFLQHWRRLFYPRFHFSLTKRPWQALPLRRARLLAQPW